MSTRSLRTTALFSPAFVVAVALMAGSAVALTASVAALKFHLQKEPIEAELKLGSLPTETRNWIQEGKDRKEDESVVKELGTTNYLNRMYKRKSPDGAGKPVLIELHCAYYTGMVDTVPHVPERCMVGGGWLIRGRPRQIPIKLDLEQWNVDQEATKEWGSETSPIYRGRLDNGLSARLPVGLADLSANCTEFSRPGSELVLSAGYFFIANGGLSSTAEGVRLLAFDLRTRYAFYLKVQVSSASVGTAEELINQSTGLIQELLPDIMQCVPDWVEVQRGNYPEDNPLKSRGKPTASATNEAIFHQV